MAVIANGIYKIYADDGYLSLENPRDQPQKRAVVVDRPISQNWEICAMDGGAFKITNCTYEIPLQLSHLQPSGDQSEETGSVWSIDRSKVTGVVFSDSEIGITGPFRIGVPDKTRLIRWEDREVTLSTTTQNPDPQSWYFLRLWFPSPRYVEAQWKRAHGTIISGIYNIRSRLTRSSIAMHPFDNEIFVIWSPDQRNHVYDQLTIGKQATDPLQSGLCVQAVAGGGKMSHARDGRVVAAQSNFVRFIPVYNSPGWYFVSPDMDSNPPKVITNPYDATICGEPLFTALLQESDQSQMWQLVPVT